MSILVTGGAGYIGSHTVAELVAQGEDIIVLDNLHTGHKKAVQVEKFYQGDVRDTALLDGIFRNHRIEAVIHLAAQSLVEESVTDPLDYYDNNVVSVHRLLSKMHKYDVKNIIFSSTAAIYGEPKQIPIQESDPTEPTNPYAETKLAVEKLLTWCDQAYGIKSVSLRYCNAAGAHPNGEIGEAHDPENHLIPIILQVALGQLEYVSIYGDDYPTDDGTCIRDYIHVMDLAHAHYLSLQWLREKGESRIYNLGNGTGFSVRQIIDQAREVTGHSIPTRTTARRPGDPAILIASADRAKKELGWTPEYSDLQTIIQTAWNWHSRHPQGYKSTVR
ncbi:UDP-glucose 4-epimerase GalE [Brevibacillus dissolubilis]|uniref:UDP-glucose 4-epimerase GalE n=1 Tax=Brevibacillus dissolubilis TaxID=1844116 RepID=UPI001116A1F8|nr:UDP-glucose 4-epimerase GalE [Brevibacillus dissolubilis]